MNIDFSEEEKAYMRGLLKDHLEYFRTLAGNGNCTENNRHFYELVSVLYSKLV